MWTWGKGDYFRLGHGCDAHVRRPTLVEALRGRRVVHVAVGALHCLAVTSDNQVSLHIVEFLKVPMCICLMAKVQFLPGPRLRRVR